MPEGSWFLVGCLGMPSQSGPLGRGGGCLVSSMCSILLNCQLRASLAADVEKKLLPPWHGGKVMFLCGCFLPVCFFPFRNKGRNSSSMVGLLGESSS